MLSEQTNISTGKHQESIDSQIELNLFVDPYFDTTGWYAFGHHQPEKFLAAVLKHDSHVNFESEDVEWKWIVQQDNEIEIIDAPVFNSQPITLVEDWGRCQCNDFLD